MAWRRNVTDFAYYFLDGRWENANCPLSDIKPHLEFRGGSISKKFGSHAKLARPHDAKLVVFQPVACVLGTGGAVPIIVFIIIYRKQADLPFTDTIDTSTSVGSVTAEVLGSYRQ